MTVLKFLYSIFKFFILQNFLVVRYFLELIALQSSSFVTQYCFEHVVSVV